MIGYDNIIYIVIAFGFVLFNAFFVIAEFSLVKLRSSQVEILYNKKALQGKILYRGTYDKCGYLSFCLPARDYTSFTRLGLGR